jgi:diaminohydroxyphosphoribosylaminopyrimidine deaminase / 5-amino-6-(5-phosphoribosylamino)uracil reductase
MLSEGFDIEEVLADLHQRQIRSIIIEGGTQLLQKFISRNLWDEARVFTGNSSFHKGIPAPEFHGVLIQEEDILGDKLAFWKA